ncbi:unnamed protein product [Cuscuta campestris]|uniref:Bifunctional inhibitor/plant lipid transfer protein/seed storage helical domain-containing protein n=1 Tax=Cuscuta campestris TaxID=132261 RepID=A0A484MGK3_9ASTE|nr:unnamed protein product [Cuscuta campestris]
MASNQISHPLLALILVINILFFTVVSACETCGPKPPPPNYPKTPCPPSSKLGKCPKDALKLGVCANVLHDLLHLALGVPPKKHCCPLIEGLVDLEAAACLCTAIKANVLGINLNVPVSLTLLLNFCGKKVPSGFQCY